MVRVSMTSSLRFIVLAQAAAPWRTVETSTLVQRLADQRVREREAVDLLGIVDDKPGRHRSLQRGDQVVGPKLARDDPEGGKPEIGPEHGRERERFQRRRRQPIQTTADDVLDALRHAPDRVRRLGEAAHQLLDEERIAPGLVAQPLGQRDVGSFLADASRDECRRIRFVEASEVHIPIPVAISRRSTVDPDGDLWLSVLKSTGQPASWGPKGEPDPVTGAPMA
jgi:hypothetical protein